LKRHVSQAGELLDRRDILRFDGRPVKINRKCKELDMEHFTAAIQQFANFEGRNTRTQYWMFILFYVIFYIVCAVVDNILGKPIISGLYSLVLLVPSIAAATRRLHDTGRSGWWQLIGLIPILGAIVLIVFLAQDSAAGDNEYGANPKEA
jgi:uncharacterized membrane protein YhaH (DUF805 family)